MSDFQKAHAAALAGRVAEALRKNGFTAQYCATREEAVEHVLSHVPAEASVGVGGSWTNREIGLITRLEERGNTVFDHNRPGLTFEQSLELRHKQLSCDVFLSGTNAVTVDGKLVNVDGIGNRVAAMVFGPKSVVIVAGVNKIVRDVDEAEKRIGMWAAPTNNHRLGFDNPCTKLGYCVDCQSPKRGCNITTIIRKKPMLTPIHVVLVGENLGF